jgi:hypothetical protein
VIVEKRKIKTKRKLKRSVVKKRNVAQLKHPLVATTPPNANKSLPDKVYLRE